MNPLAVQLSDPTPEFRWTPLELPGPAGPFTYTLQVLSDREEDIVQVHGSLQSHRFEIQEPLPFNIPLRWRVIAQARSGRSGYGDQRGTVRYLGNGEPACHHPSSELPESLPESGSGGV